MTDIEQVIDALLAKWSAGSRKNHLGMLVEPINLVPGQSGTLSASVTDEHDEHLGVRPPAIGDPQVAAIGARPSNSTRSRRQRHTWTSFPAAVATGRRCCGGSRLPLRAVAAA